MGELKFSVENRVILVTDIHDFSILVTDLGQKQYEFIQEFYERIGDIIVAYQGEIIKYMGDAILSIFPSGSEETVIQCAVELRIIFSQIITQRNIPQKAELEVGIGSGNVAIGLFGHRSLNMKDVFGEEISRTFTIMHHRGIAITETVYEKIRLTYQTRALPEITVKWQKDPLKSWEVIT